GERRAPIAAGSATPPYNGHSLTHALAAQIAERFRVAVDPIAWADKPLPDHLRVRVRVCDERGRELAASRDLAELHALLQGQTRAASAAVARAEPDAWRRARAQHESPPHAAWNFGAPPARVLVTEQAGVPVFAFPALRAEPGGVAVRLCQTPEEAAAVTRAGLAHLLELQFSRDLTWLERDLRALREVGPLAATLTPVEELQAHAFAAVRTWLCDPDRCRAGSPPPPSGGERPASVAAGSTTPPYNSGASAYALDAAAFAAALDSARADLRGLVPRTVALVREILELRQTLLVVAAPYPGLDRDLSALVPPDFLRATPFARLAQLPRYLKAMQWRADRARKNPSKDAERAAQLAPYLAAFARLSGAATPPSRPGAKAVETARPPSAAVEALRWLIEEFRVSLFAQELGTAEPVSAKKLDRLLADLAPAAAKPASEPTAKPIVTAAVGAKKNAPLKNFGALDNLFRR
ncbi:MAG: hypothetical protein RLZZ15_2539, partial [Verrucomicrobiota bacterium]